MWPPPVPPKGGSRKEKVFKVPLGGFRGEKSKESSLISGR